MEKFVKELDDLGLSLRVRNEEIILFGKNSKLNTREILNSRDNKHIPDFIRENKTQLLEYLNRKREAEYSSKLSLDKISAIYELSPLQEGILFHSLYDQNITTYITQFRLELPDKLNIPAFKAAWERLIRNHSILRTAFIHEKVSIPVQCVYKQAILPFEIIDYSHFSEAELENRFERLLAQDRMKRFNFETPPLMRITLVKISEMSYRMIWTKHHILWDGWSGQVVISEVLKAYEQYAAGLQPEEMEEDLYEDYIKYINRIDPYKEKYFWKQYMEGFEEASLLPFVSNTIVRNKGIGTFMEVSLVFDEQITRQLHQYAQSLHITPNTFLQGVWSFLLSRYSGKQDVVFGATVSGRPAEMKYDRKVGLYINTLPFRAKINPERKVADWLQELQQKHVETREYQYTAINQVQQWIGISGDLFDSILVFNNYPLSEVSRSGTRPVNIGSVEIAENNNYLLSVQPVLQDKLIVAFKYNSSLLDTAYVEMISRHFNQVVRELIAKPEVVLSDICWLNEEERLQLLTEFNNTAKPYPAESTIVDIFEKQVRKTPDNIALIFNDEILTYKELNERSDKLAWHLRNNCNLKTGDLAGVMMSRSVWSVVAILGILKAGAAYVPIDINYPEERKRYIVEDTALSILLIESAAMFDVLEWNVPILALDIQFDSFDTPVDYTRNYKIDPADTAYVIYTSGSTGKPKGVMIAHTSNVNMSLDQIIKFGIEPQDRVLQFASLSFDASVSEIFMALYCGACLVLIPEQVIADADRFIRYLVKKEVTVATLPPLYLHALDRDRFDFLRVIITAGEAALPADVFHYALVSEYYNAYGPTECAVCVSIYKAESSDTPGKQIPVGRPLANMQVFILDPEMSLLPIGAEGYIYVGGVGLAKGYLNRPELTKEKFIDNPFGTGKLYKTGDRGRWLPDGNIEFLGRTDDQVKIRGYRIELGEISNILGESALIKEHVIIAKDDKSEGKRLIAYVVTAGESYDRETLRKWLAERLPEYMIPSLVELEELPLTVSGKVDKKALHDLDAVGQQQNAYVAPRSETEEKLVSLWQDLLGIKQVGIYDDFFSLGGHSLLIIRAVAAVQKEFNVKISVTAWFELNTVANLAGYITYAGTLKDKTGAEAAEFETYDL
ncbi:amino acid adenylation domain-containing protein [Chitinophaga sp. YR573]|uniref:non-ribosomal peptide synthetase n=1 Tax=Chitinophaga sp. YR573 TaxID=1881040 RepID=UPI0008AB1596|nr:non-ribosomal peptide synthetase [Chitinophaga sp. YR573]SEW42708.1 amino acid adenylation domain-containing protein [Chitinophaga sp. YR573]